MKRVKLKYSIYCDQALRDSDHSEQNQCDQDDCDHDDKQELILYLLNSFILPGSFHLLLPDQHASTQKP